MVIRFRPGCLGAKPDALTRCWDVYPKEGSSGYTSVNPHNFRPVFTSEQIQHSLRATSLLIPVLRSSVIMDLETLHNDIRNSLHSDPFAIPYIENPELNPRWKLVLNLIFVIRALRKLVNSVPRVFFHFTYSSLLFRYMLC